MISHLKPQLQVVQANHLKIKVIILKEEVEAVKDNISTVGNPSYTNMKME